MKFIALSQNIDYLPKRNEFRNSIDQNILKFINECSYEAILINNFIKTKKYTLQKKKLFSFLNNFNFSGIILSGGNDIGKFIQRDTTEKYLIEYAIKKSIPLLGICRGMQMINHYYGGTLKKIENHVKKNNLIKYKKKSIKIRCFHANGILKLGKDLEVTGVSRDRNTESIKHTTRKIYGWMFHPERNAQHFKYLKKEMKKILEKS